jgi:hypothetical protein
VCLGLPDPEYGTARAGGDRHPADVPVGDDFERCHDHRQLPPKKLN